jgi:uncharacterized protein YjbI with pentapeptide repeats
LHLFFFTRYDEFERIPHQFRKLETKIIVKLIKLQKETEQIFDWSKYEFDLFPFGSIVNEFLGLELPYKKHFVNAKLLRTTFTQTDFSLLNLKGMSSNKSIFDKSGFNGTNLNDVNLLKQILKKQYYRTPNLRMLYYMIQISLKRI